MSRGLVFLVYTMEGNTPLFGGAFLTIEQANQCIESIRENDELTHGDPVQYCISSIPLDENLFLTRPKILGISQQSISQQSL